MAARPNPDEYSLPAKWVPVSGELARGGRILMSLSETQRLLFYNQDVLYHQNLEILQMLDELRVQNSNASSRKNSNSQASAESEEAESEQKPILEMPAPPVPSVRLPPVLSAEPPTSSTIPTVALGLSSSTNPTASINTGSTSAAQASPFSLARANSLSGFAPMPSNLLNPQELPPTVKVPSWQARINSLLSGKNKQGKREADNSDLEEDNGHGMASNPLREELFKRQKLEEASKTKEGNAVPGFGVGFFTVGGKSTNGSADTNSFASSSALGFLATPSKPGVIGFGTHSPFQSGAAFASECQGTGSTPFKAHTEKEGAESPQINHHQCIIYMPEYQKFSFEELRLADYARGRKYGAAPTFAGFGQTKSGAATTSAIYFGQRNTGLFGFSTNKAISDGSPFSKLSADNSLSKSATSIFGAGSAPLPAWNSGSVREFEWPWNTTTNKAPSELGKFSVARAATGPQTQSQAQNPRFGSRSNESPEPTTNIFSKPLASTTTAPSLATAPPLKTLGSEPHTTKGELPNTINIRVRITEPKERAESKLDNCVISSFHKTHIGETKRRLLVINNDNGELILDTTLMKTVGFARTRDGTLIRGISTEGIPFKCVVESTDTTGPAHLDRLLEQALALY